MSTTPEGARRALLTQLEAFLIGEEATPESIVDLVIRAGWQPRPVPDPDSDYLRGRLLDGRSVPIEIRHARRQPA